MNWCEVCAEDISEDILVHYARRHLNVLRNMLIHGTEDWMCVRRHYNWFGNDACSTCNEPRPNPPFASMVEPA